MNTDSRVKLTDEKFMKSMHIFFSATHYKNLFDDIYVGDAHNLNMQNKPHLERKGNILYSSFRRDKELIGKRYICTSNRNSVEIEIFIFEIYFLICTFGCIYDKVQIRNRK